MAVKLTVLGVNSASPAYGRHPSAQVLQVNEQLFLIDCGEGTQMRLNTFRIKSSKIRYIFITHMHGDHYLGLPALIDSFNLSGRTKALDIYGPPDLLKVLELHWSITGKTQAQLPFPLSFHPVLADESSLLLETEAIEVSSVVLEHGIACTGFVFRQKPNDRKMIGEKIETYNIPYTAIPSIKKGADFVQEDGTIIPNKELTLDPLPPASYAYCSDTAYSESIVPHIKGVDVLYHEATYLKDKSLVALERGHSTAEQAAMIAQLAEVKYLLLGHFSSRYYELSPFLREARAIFPNTHLAEEGSTYELV